MKESARRDILIIIGMLATVVIPVALTLMTIRAPVRDLPVVDQSPSGYTVSLLLFLVPILAISQWHLRRGTASDRKAFLWSVGIMAGIGTVLDIAFGYHFFEFPNRAATLGIRISAWNWADMTFVHGYLPVEEFAFYILGGIFMAATYLWAEQTWMQPMSREDYEEAAAAHPKLVGLSGVATAVWVVILALGYGYHLLAQSDFPGYFTFVMFGGAAPTLLLIRGVKDFVNWHAMSFAFFALLLLSIIWEASLAIPYGWWGYKGHEMLGIYIAGWSDLPIEAVMVWIIGVWDAVLIYEFLRIFFRMKLEPRKRFLGHRGEGEARPA